MIFPNQLQAIAKRFPIALDPRLQRGFCQILDHLIRTKSCLLSEWARRALYFDAFIKKTCRFFRNKRCNWKMQKVILDWMLPRFETKKFIPILIDPSFVTNRYLGSFTKTKADQPKPKKGFFLFCASLPVKGRAISFFQACYRLRQIDYIHGNLNKLWDLYLTQIYDLLKPSLAKVVFIMDRGFGYEFFIKTMAQFQTHYVIRARNTSTHVLLKRTRKKYSIQQLIDRAPMQSVQIFALLYKKTTPTYLVISKSHRGVWALLTDIDNEKEVLSLYKQRMKIEEAFKDWKSTGFNIEKLQIRQWNVLPKLIWCVVIAHMLLYLLGEVLSRSKENKNYFKKFIQKKKNLSHVQLAWKIWLYAYDDLNHFLKLLFSSLNTKRVTL